MKDVYSYRKTRLKKYLGNEVKNLIEQMNDYVVIKKSIAQTPSDWIVEIQIDDIKISNFGPIGFNVNYNQD